VAASFFAIAGAAYPQSADHPGSAADSDSVIVRDSCISPNSLLTPAACSPKRNYEPANRAFHAGSAATGKRWALAANRIALGLFSAGFCMAGIYYNSLAEAQIARQRKILRGYQSAHSDFYSYKSEYDEARLVADKNITVRNLLYGVAGLEALGLAVSFSF
jgi:hypothetical protein